MAAEINQRKRSWRRPRKSPLFLRRRDPAMAERDDGFVFIQANIYIEEMGKG